jgi:hypothetical protein
MTMLFEIGGAGLKDVAFILPWPLLSSVQVYN